MTGRYSGLPNKLVSTANGVDYAYREVGEGAVPLVVLQHAEISRSALSALRAKR
jgi:hypothetical protein